MRRCHVPILKHVQDKFQIRFKKEISKISDGLSKIIIIGALFFTNCKKEEKTGEQPQPDQPKITIERFSLTETKSGKKLWVLDASLANVYDEVIVVDTVKVQFYNEEGVVFSILFGLGGTLNTKNHNILVKDSVKLFTDDSTTLFTDSLFWQNESQKILTDARVRILKQDGTMIDGKGLRTNPDLKRIEIIGDITGESPIQFPKIK